MRDTTETWLPSHPENDDLSLAPLAQRGSLSIGHDMDNTSRISGGGGCKQTAREIRKNHSAVSTRNRPHLLLAFHSTKHKNICFSTLYSPRCSFPVPVTPKHANTRYWVTMDMETELRGTCHFARVNDVIFPAGCSDLFITCSVADIRVWNAALRQELLRIQASSERRLIPRVKRKKPGVPGESVSCADPSKENDCVGVTLVC